MQTLLIPALAASPYAFSAAPLQSHESILKAARNHARDNASGYSIPPTVTTGRLDSRLRLPRCSHPLETFSPPAGRKLGRTTVGIRCAGDKPWSLYVPVTVSLNAEVVVAARNLPRGTILRRADLVLKKQDITRLRGRFFDRPAQATGKMLKRNLQQGQALLSQHMVTRKTVKKGGKVIILAASEKIQVRMPGKALSSGAIGERIRVQNIRSKKEIEAVVVSAGVVRVTL